jgi:hypothetical protein
VSNQSKPEKFRQWVLVVLDMAGSPSARQLHYVRTFKVGVDEIVLQLDDMFNVARAKFGNGTMDIAEFRWFEIVNRQAWEIEASSKDLWN